MTREELTLKAIATYNGNLYSGMTTALGAVVDMVLEEAARVADEMAEGEYVEQPAHVQSKEIAAAIRALKEETK